MEVKLDQLQLVGDPRMINASHALIVGAGDPLCQNVPGNSRFSYFRAGGINPVETSEEKSDVFYGRESSSG